MTEFQLVAKSFASPFLSKIKSETKVARLFCSGRSVSRDGSLQQLQMWPDQRSAIPCCGRTRSSTWSMNHRDPLWRTAFNCPTRIGAADGFWPLAPTLPDPHSATQLGDQMRSPFSSRTFRGQWLFQLLNCRIRKGITATVSVRSILIRSIFEWLINETRRLFFCWRC